jgi:cyanophycin synthetase
VPAKGTRVVLRNNANLSTGGTATDVTDDVHPESPRAPWPPRKWSASTSAASTWCAKRCSPFEEQAGGIVEVNAAPGLRMHLQPSYGKGRAVGEAIISTMFADGDDGRIPVVAVAGTNGKTTTVRLIAHLLASSGLRVGMTNTDGVYIQGAHRHRRLQRPAQRAQRAAAPGRGRRRVRNRARRLLREGLAFDRCDVAVVTNIGMATTWACRTSAPSKTWPCSSA